jgi:chromosome segregation ATPase
MTESIWEKLNTVTADAQNAAVAKAKDSKFDLNKGQITMDESFINLNDDIATLRDAIQKKKLQQLPISLQRSLHDDIEKISKCLTSLAAGTDEVINLTDAIEVLHTDIWKLGLQLLSDEYLGYQTKLNQIKNLEIELGKLKASLEHGITTKSELESILASAKKTDLDLTSQLDTLKLSVKKVSEDSEKIQTSEQAAAASLKIVQTNQETIAGQLSSTTASSGEISALETRIKDFYKNIDEYRASIDTTTTTATSTVKKE